MEFKDRSDDFRSIIKSLSGSSGGGNGISRDNGPDQYTSHPQSKNRVLNSYNSQNHHHSIGRMKQFNTASQDLSRKICQSLERLEKLSMLAKNQSLFEDRTSEIQQLTVMIKQDIANYPNQLMELQEIRNSMKPSSFISQKNNDQNSLHSQSVVNSLKSRIYEMRSNFETQLKSHWRVLKKQEERRDNFVGSLTQQCTDENKSQSIPLVPSRLLQDDFRAKLLEAEADGRPMGNIQTDYLENVRKQEQVLLNLPDQSIDYLTSRTEAISNIEATIQELGKIFTQLSTLVSEQEESVARISCNVDNVQENVDLAHTEIFKYFQSISSNRWLFAKVGGVLVIFFILFVVLFS